MLYYVLPRPLIGSILYNAMAFQSVPQCASIEIVFSAGGVTVENQLHAKFSGDYVQSNLDDLAANVDVAVGTYYVPITHDFCTYLHTHVRGLTSIIDLEATDGTNTDTGPDSTGPKPNNVTLAISLRTGHTGRSARGRLYMVGLANDKFLNTNEVETSYATAAIAMVGHIQTAISAAGWTMGIVSRFSGGVKRTTGIFTPITDIIVVNKVSDSQRGRLPQGH